MNYKPKIKYKLMAALVAAFSLFCLTISASAAWTGLNGGATSNGGFTLMGVPFGILSYNDQFAWRADLYVSANPDGKINKSDIIGSTQLPLVGSVFCASPQYAADSSWKTYIQTDYTNEDRGSFSSSGVTPGTLSYTLPTLAEFEPKHLAKTPPKSLGGACLFSQKILNQIIRVNFRSAHFIEQLNELTYFIFLRRYVVNNDVAAANPVAYGIFSLQTDL